MWLLWNTKNIDQIIEHIRTKGQIVSVCCQVELNPSGIAEVGATPLLYDSLLKLQPKFKLLNLW